MGRLVRCALAVGLTAVGVAGCAGRGGDEATGRGEFSGYYYTAFETSNFVPGEDCRNQEPTYWLVYERGSGFSEALEAAGWKPTRLQAFYVRFEGELSEPGQYGHLGAYKHEVRVMKTLEVRAAPECIEPSR